MPACAPRRHLPIQAPRGVTLLEVMVVCAIVAVLAAMTINGWSGVGARMAAQNASFDLGGLLSSARSRAVARGQDVWVIVYPSVARGGGAGRGAYFLYDDPDLTFGLDSAGVPGELKYSAFAPDNTHGTAGRGSLIEEKYLEDYPGKNVDFEPPSGAGFHAPFTQLNPVTRACSFCTAGPGGDRGAIVFTASGAARLVQGDGTPAPQRSGSLSLHRAGSNETFLFGIAGPTGYTEVQSP